MRWKVSWGKKDWNLARNKALQDRGAPLGEEGDTIREYKAMDEENFLSSWLRMGKVRQKKRNEVDKEVGEDVGKKGKRESGRKEKDETVVMRNCVNPVSVEAFDIFSQGEISECDSCGVNSDSESGDVLECTCE